MKVALTLLIALLQATGAAGAIAADGPGQRKIQSKIQSEIRAVLISPVVALPSGTLAAAPPTGSIAPTPAAISAGASDEIEIVYDAAALTDTEPTGVTFWDLERESARMRTSEYVQAQRTVVSIPTSTSSVRDLDQVRDAGPAALAQFIGRKQAYLEKIAGALAILKTRPSVINRVLGLVNEQFFKRAASVMKANSQAAVIGFGIGGGMGVPAWLLGEARRSPLLRNIPENAGFYFGLSVGLAFVHVFENGKSRLRFEPFAEFRRATKILGPFVSVGGSLYTGISLEQTGAAPVQQSEFFSISRIGLSWSERSVSIGTPIVGASFPPFGSRFSVIHGKTVGFRANREGLAQLGNYLRDFFDPRPYFKPGACRAVFASRLTAR